MHTMVIEQIAGTLLFLIPVVCTLLWIPLGALFLWLSSILFTLKKKKYRTALSITATLHLVFFLLLLLVWLLNTNWLIKFLLFLAMFIIWFPISWMMVKTGYGIGWIKALLVWLVWMGFSFMIGWIFWIILAFIFGFAAFAAAIIP